MVSFIQVPIGMVLMFVLFFGIGFILNMLTKTTYAPLYGYVVFIIGYGLNQRWTNCDDGALCVVSAPATYFYELSLINYLFIISGFIGAAVSGWAIQTLRVKGFKMF